METIILSLGFSLMAPVIAGASLIFTIAFLGAVFMESLTYFIDAVFSDES
jgi:hypothetical protein